MPDEIVVIEVRESVANLTPGVPPVLRILEIGKTGPQGPQGLQGPQGPVAPVSAAAGNILTFGPDGGLFVQQVWSGSPGW
jgi:hypothetical protein